jgi:phytoene synthase
LADDELDEAVRRADPDRWLASRFIGDPATRADVIALYAFDHELARAPRVASNSLIAEIRLTWWLEALEEAYAGGPVRAHPVARALAAAIGRRSPPRPRLEAMVLSRIAAIDHPRLDAGQAVAWADGVAGSAASLAAHILDPASPADAAGPAGRLWGLRRLVVLGLAEADDIAPLIRETLPLARREARRLSARAFPAVAQATLARAELRGRKDSDLAVRSRLLWAVATGGL